MTPIAPEHAAGTRQSIVGFLLKFLKERSQNEEINEKEKEKNLYIFIKFL